MPSLQQLNLKDCSPTSDIGRGLSGSDILHKHSINSLLEQNDIINRGLASPMEGEKISSFSDFFNENKNTSPYQLSKQHNNSFSSTQSSTSCNSIGSNFFPSGNNSSFMATGQSTADLMSTKQQTNSGGTGTNQMTQSTHNNNQNNATNNAIYNHHNNSNNCSNMQSAKTTLDSNNFQLDNGHTGGMGQTPSLKVIQQRNHLTLDCTPASPRNFPNHSPLFSTNGFNNFDTNFPHNVFTGSNFANGNYRSASPNDYNDNTNLLSSLENHNLMDLMNYLSLNSPPCTLQAPFQQQQQTSTPFGSVGSGGSGCTSPMSPTDIDLARFNTLRLYQQQQQQAAAAAAAAQQMSPLSGFNPITLNQLLQTYNMNQCKNWQLPQTPRSPTTPTPS